MKGVQRSEVWEDYDKKDPPNNKMSTISLEGLAENLIKSSRQQTKHIIEILTQHGRMSRQLYQMCLFSGDPVNYPVNYVGGGRNC